jgi:hypothetical protein
MQATSEGSSPNRVTGDGHPIAIIVLIALLIAFFVALLFPSTDSRPGRNSANNAKCVCLALLGYYDKHAKFPPAMAKNEAGEPLLSWRVAILPYLDETVLFNKFNQDEPWNGPDNQRLIAFEPRVFISPKATGQAPGETNILGIVGPDTVLTADGGNNLKDVTDGTSNTIVAVELAGAGITWSEPRDVSVDEFIAAMQRKPWDTGLRPVYPQGVICCFADGAVRLIPVDTPPETLRAMCTRAGGEPVAIPGMD